MKAYAESKVLLEVRCIKEKLSEEAASIGPEKFYLSLNGTAARLMAKYRARPRAPGKAKRRAPTPPGALALHEKPAEYKTH